MFKKLICCSQAFCSRAVKAEAHSLKARRGGSEYVRLFRWISESSSDSENWKLLLCRALPAGSRRSWSRRPPPSPCGRTFAAFQRPRPGQVPGE